MPEAEATVTPEVTETIAPEVNGTEVDASTETPTTEEVKTEVAETVDKAEYERLKKEYDKSQQEINLRRNKEAQIKREALEEAGKIEEAYEALKAELAAKEALSEKEREQKELEDLKESVFKEFPDEIAKLGKSLNVTWDSAQTFDEAKEQVRAKLTALQGALKPAEVEEDVEIHANNPLGEVNGKPFESLSLEEMRKVLPKADSR